jgi:hypothetical protein
MTGLEPCQCANARGVGDTRFKEIRMERRFADLYKWSFVFWRGAIGFAVIARILIR